MLTTLEQIHYERAFCTETWGDPVAKTMEDTRSTRRNKRGLFSQTVDWIFYKSPKQSSKQNDEPRSVTDTAIFISSAVELSSRPNFLFKNYKRTHEAKKKKKL